MLNSSIKLVASPEAVWSCAANSWKELCVFPGDLAILPLQEVKHLATSLRAVCWGFKHWRNCSRGFAKACTLSKHPTESVGGSAKNSLI